MPKPVYINGLSSISAQSVSVEMGVLFNKINEPEGQFYHAIDANYRKYLKPSAMRRMSKLLKMGVFCAYEVLEDAGIENPTAIITGTGMGCKQDSDKFLGNLLQENEGLLAPTKFIQSTHNTVGGQIALNLQCKAPNFTHVQGASSFENALLDAKISMETSTETENILVGGLDEISMTKIGQYQNSGQDYPIGEGACFFMLSNQKTEKSYAKLEAVSVYNSISEEDLWGKLQQFLKQNNFQLENIDTLVLGENVGKSTYFEILKDKFTAIPQLHYKHLIGEFYTASAFGFWLGCKILKTQILPESFRLNAIDVRKPLETVLLYNQFHGRDHSFTLLTRC